MFFNKKREDKIAKAIEEADDNAYWAIVRKQFYKNTLAVWSLRLFYVIFGIALMADFIANERPIYCQLKIENNRDTLSVAVDTTASKDTLYLNENSRPYFDAENADTDIEYKLGPQRTSQIIYTKTYTRSVYNYPYDSASNPQKDPNLASFLVHYDTTFRQVTTIAVDSAIRSYFPVFRQYAVNLGLSSWEEFFVSTKWLEHRYELVFFPPITYSATTRDALNNKFKSPFGPQKFPENSNGGWHYLGTERIGQDVAAGMIHGTRTAMLVGVVAMTIATLLGLFFGSLSGYFGDDRLKVSRIRVVLNIIAVVLAYFFAFISSGYLLTDLIGSGNLFIAILIILAWFSGLLILANLLTIPLKKITYLGKKMTFPMDIIIMRLIEVVTSIPLLILILAIVAIIEKPSVLFVMVIIGSVSWTGIAKFIRAELLRIRRLEYIEAAQAFGYSDFRIIIKHAIPNALAPVFIAIAFGVASAILMEAFLSFIGVGIPDDQVTWGSLLRLSRDKFSAWWLAVFPGFAIFITVTIFNLIGEGLTEALDPRLRE